MNVCHVLTTINRLMSEMLRKWTKTRFPHAIVSFSLRKTVLVNSIKSMWLAALLINHRWKCKNLNFSYCWMPNVYITMPSNTSSFIHEEAWYNTKQRPYTLNHPNYPIHFTVESNRRGSSNQKSPFVLCPYKARTILGTEVGRRPSLMEVGELGSMYYKLLHFC